MRYYMTKYVWEVWKNNRLVGYVVSVGEISALASAKSQYGENIYVYRTCMTEKVS